MRNRLLLWTETIGAGLSGVLGLLTLVRPAWLEAVGWNPDRGSGAVEWVVVGVLLAVALVAGAVAGLEWRRLAHQS